ncbi:hypothetical protein C0W35_19680, partial [Photobacterium kishitanii]|uniref:hypothetical protein n=1 Tax=Photobacterium kishitanii TaxID=318456 RepID=UPI000D422372
MKKILFKIDDFYSFIFSLFMVFYLNPVAWGDSAISLLKIFSVLIVLLTLYFYKDVLFLNIKSSLIFTLSCLCIIILCIIFGKIVSTVNYT